MRQESMKILFVTKKGSVMKNGELPIIIRITIDGVRDEARIQRSIAPNLWNQDTISSFNYNNRLILNTHHSLIDLFKIQ